MSSIDLFGPLELTELREMASAALPDTGTVTRPGTGGTLDPVTGDWTPNAGTVTYTGRMRIRGATAQDSDIVFGDTEVSTSRMIGVLPHNAPEIHVDDVITVNTSSDIHIAARAFRVRVVAHHSYLTDRRLGLEIVE